MLRFVADLITVGILLVGVVLAILAADYLPTAGHWLSRAIRNLFALAFRGWGREEVAQDLED